MLLERNSSRFLRSALLLAAAVLLAVAPPAGALACGMPLSASIPAEQALIVAANGREEIITSVQIQRAQPDAAVIFPVPGVPEVSALAGADLFGYLADVTRPKERVEERLVWRSRGEDLAAGGAPGGVDVLGRGIIGGYDVAQLRADDAGALQAWLDENGYRAPEGSEPILRAYIAEGWKFVAVKLAPGQPADGALTPLRMAFDSREIVYPMRLGALADRPLDVQLYVLADHRVELPGMEMLYAGSVRDLDRPPPGDLAPLFRAPFLTRLRNRAVAPASLSADFVARPAADDAPFRAETVRIVYVDGWSRMALPILGVAVVLLASAIALGIAFGLRRRIDALAGPDPHDEED